MLSLLSVPKAGARVTLRYSLLFDDAVTSEKSKLVTRSLISFLFVGIPSAPARETATTAILRHVAHRAGAVQDVCGRDVCKGFLGSASTKDSKQSGDGESKRFGITLRALQARAMTSLFPSSYSRRMRWLKA